MKPRRHTTKGKNNDGVTPGTTSTTSPNRTRTTHTTPRKRIGYPAVLICPEPVYLQPISRTYHGDNEIVGPFIRWEVYRLWKALFPHISDDTDSRCELLTTLEIALEEIEAIREANYLDRIESVSRVRRGRNVLDFKLPEPDDDETEGD